MNLNTNTSMITFDTTEPERIKILDSDRNYIDYFVDDANGRKLAEHLAYEIRLKNTDNEIALAVYNCVDAITFVVNPTDTFLQEIIDIYGNEYVNRIGNCFLIFDE